MAFMSIWLLLGADLVSSQPAAFRENERWVLDLDVTPDGNIVVILHTGEAFISAPNFTGRINLRLTGKSVGNLYRGNACVDNQGRIYIFNTYHQRFDVFGPDGQFLKNITLKDTLWFVDCFVYPDGRIAVLSDWFHLAYLIDSTGKIVGQTGPYWDPKEHATGREGRLVRVDTATGTAAKWDFIYVPYNLTEDTILVFDKSGAIARKYPPNPNYPPGALCRAAGWRKNALWVLLSWYPPPDGETRYVGVMMERIAGNTRELDTLFTKSPRFFRRAEISGNKVYLIHEDESLTLEVWEMK